MPSPVLRHLAGHLQTTAPALLDRVWPQPAPPSEPWSTFLDDPRLGRLRLTGRLTRATRSDLLVVVVHGIGSSAEAWYCRRAAVAAATLGISTLRIDLRGADRSGSSIYHAGLTDDLHATLADPVVADFSRVAVLGYSLGGHVTLRTATEALPAHVVAVAAVSPPLDLAAGATWIDAPQRLPYRRHLLSGLREIHAQVAARQPVATSVAEADTIRSLRVWDDRIVAPWFGFASAEDYYARMSVGPRLERLTVPTLIVHSTQDPIVGPAAGAAALTTPSPRLTVRTIDAGGHVVLPAASDLGLGLGGGDAAVLRWLLAQEGT